MNERRYQQIMASEENEPLLPYEIAEGWHFCAEFDGLLVGPAMGELRACHCLPKEHPVYQTAPVEPTTT